MNYVNTIAKEFNINGIIAENVIRLLKKGATVPFIARYRKEMTDTMNEETLAAINKRLTQFDELQKRKEFVLEAIAKQNKLTLVLEKNINKADTLQEVEDLYLPYKSKHHTKADTARQKGLEPLAKLIMLQDSDDVLSLAKRFIDKNKDVNNEEEALKGACDIIAKWISENIEGRNKIRDIYHKKGILSSTVVKKKEAEAQTYKQYFDFQEPIAKMPSHRILALFRAEAEGLLRVKLHIDTNDALNVLDCIFLKNDNSSTDLVQKTIDDAWKRLLEPSLETEIRSFYKEKADEVAIKVFAENLKQLLLEAPLGKKRVLAIDPGFRTGCKVVILNESGALLHNETIYPHPPHNEHGKSAAKIANLVQAYKIDVIAIGNGTAGRETEDFIKSIRFDRDITAVMVNESGASIYSASNVAREEFPNYDITVRGAVSIGRRLMDPLAELVKIDPKSIGVGQYQHDVDQKMLGEELKTVVEHCVNSVGVDVNTASKQLLSYVSGINSRLAWNIVDCRAKAGSFKTRNNLKMVPGIGDKTFQQCAGFLRIHDSEQPLDASAVHPECYHIVEKMANKLKVNVEKLIGNEELIAKINPKQFIEEDFGVETINDIIEELKKPGRDPRKTFEMIEFDKNIRTINDLRQGMQLVGIVTNITAFGCFVDVGVHQDGLVHISQMSNDYISDPNHVVKLNQKVKVTVTDVDITRKRISLSMK